MRCIVPQITWNTREPVLSIDFDPSCKYEDGFYRLVSGGADQQLLIWHIRDADTLKPNLLCVAELKRHVKTVNVVRFSPDGNFIASADDDAYILIWKNETKSDKEESWLMDKTLRRHLEDVSDLCWSADGAILVSGSVDNSAVVWDVKKGTPIYNWSDHVGFVNGVSYDPLKEYIVTMCIDRTLRVFNAKSGKLNHKLLKFPPPWLGDCTTQHNVAEETVVESPALPSAAAPADKENENINPEVASEEPVKKPHVAAPFNRMFCDADDTFCRRMSFSPKGELLMVPGGLLPPRSAKEVLNASTAVSNTTPASSPSDGKSKGKKMKKCGEKPAANNNALLIFCRNSMTTPCAIIPTGTSLSTVVRFSPLYYERDRLKFNYDPDFSNPTLKSERTAACVGRLRPPPKAKRVLMDMPYRLVFAVATNDSVIIGDTASPEPLAVIKNIHCTRITDVSWSADGRVCVSSSTDGYCSLITFEKGELGVEFPAVQVSSGAIDCFPIPPPKKVKPKAVKKKEAKQKPVVLASPATKAVAVEKPKIEKILVVEEEKDVSGDDKQSPKSAVTPKPVQKNNLLKWVIKKPKLEEGGSMEDKAKQPERKVGTPFRKPVLKEPELICLDSNSCGEMPMDDESGAIKPSTENKKTILSFFKSQPNKQDISQRELLKLQTAPLKNTPLLEASIAENLHGIPMEVDSSENPKETTSKLSSSQGVEKSEGTKNSESLGNTESSPTINSTNNTSPVSSTTAKPPRRIQLITLTAVAPKKEKGNLD